MDKGDNKSIITIQDFFIYVYMVLDSINKSLEFGSYKFNKEYDDDRRYYDKIYIKLDPCVNIFNKYNNNAINSEIIKFNLNQYINEIKEIITKIDNPDLGVFQSLDGYIINRMKDMSKNLQSLLQNIWNIVKDVNNPSISPEVKELIKNFVKRKIEDNSKRSNYLKGGNKKKSPKKSPKKSKSPKKVKSKSIKK